MTDFDEVMCECGHNFGSHSAYFDYHCYLCNCQDFTEPTDVQPDVIICLKNSGSGGPGVMPTK